MNVETRWCDVRLDGRSVGGYVVRYADKANIGGVFIETVAPGAFRTTGEAILNVMHDRSKLIAREGSGLRFDDGSLGMTWEAKLPSFGQANDALEMVRSGLLRGCSVEMVVRADEWSEGSAKRRILSAELHGLALVDRPAYPQSSIDLRSRVVTTTRRYFL